MPAKRAAASRAASRAAAKNAPRAEGSRRTRAHPSPGGFKELPEPTRKSKQTSKKIGKNESTPAPIPASGPEHEENAFSTTSRSQSPTEHSESPQPQIPESRSTSPPNQQPLPTTTSHTSPLAQLKSPKRSVRGVITGTKRTRENDKDIEQRPTKRSRSRVTAQIPEKQLQYDSDTSIEVTVSQPRIAHTTPHHDDSSEADMDIEESNRATVISPLQQRQFASAKSRRLRNSPKQVAQSSGETKKNKASLSMEEREKIYFEKYGKKMPAYNPHLNARLRNRGSSYNAPFIVSDDEESGESEEDLSEEYIDGPSFTKMYLKNWAKNNPKTPKTSGTSSGLSQNQPKSTDTSKINGELEVQASSPRPSTTNPNSQTNPSRLVIPATSSSPEQVVTKPELIDAILSLIKWAEDDNTRVVPTAQQMEVLLDRFNAQEQAKIQKSPRSLSPLVVSRAASPTITCQEHEKEQETCGLGFDVRSQEESIHGDVKRLGDQSEVSNETQEPHTPAGARLQQSRSIWTGLSAVKTLISTPLNYIRGRTLAADGTANNTSGSGEFTFRHSHRLPSNSDFPSTPSRPAVRKLGAQTDRRGNHQTNYERVAQSERRPRQTDEPKPPMHLRGTTSVARIAEIHRERDREKLREAVESNSPDTISHPDRLSPARTGEKRKRPSDEIKPPETSSGSTFCVPDWSSDEDSDGGDQEMEDVSKDLPTSNRGVEWAKPNHIPGAYIEDDEIEGVGKTPPISNKEMRHMYASQFRIPLHQVPHDDYLIRMFRPWTSHVNAVKGIWFKGQEDIDWSNIQNRQYEAEKVAAEKAGLPLYQGIPEPVPLALRWDDKYFDPKYQATVRPVSLEDFGPPKPKKKDIPNDQIPRYTGSVAQQPGFVQANIDAGVYPSKFQSTPIRPTSLENLFGPRQSTIPDNPFPKSFFKLPAKNRESNDRIVKTPMSSWFGPNGGHRADLPGSPKRPRKHPITTPTSPNKPNTPKAFSSSLWQTKIVDAGSGSGPPAPTSSYGLPSTFGLDGQNQDVTPMPTTTTAMAPKSTAPKPAVEKLPELPPLTASPLLASTNAHTHSNPVSPSKSSEVLDASSPTVSHDSVGLDASTNPLSPKKWEQTPPPKPRPSNAKLPQQQVQHVTDELSNSQVPQEQTQRAKALKFAPVRPSRLRNMTQMSPLPLDQEKENRAKMVANGFILDDTQYFCKEVNDLIASIPEDKIPAMELPRYLYEGWPSPTVSEKATEQYFST